MSGGGEKNLFSSSQTRSIEDKREMALLASEMPLCMDDISRPSQWQQQENKDKYIKKIIQKRAIHDRNKE